MIYGGCNCGNCHMTILPTGDIYACRRVQNSKVGNVFRTGSQTCGSAGWRPIGITANSKSAQNANCCLTAAAAPQWQAARTETFMRLTRNAGKRCKHGIFRSGKTPAFHPKISGPANRTRRFGKIIQAGLCAPNAGGGQRAIIVAVRNRALCEKSGG